MVECSAPLTVSIEIVVQYGNIASSLDRPEAEVELKTRIGGWHADVEKFLRDQFAMGIFADKNKTTSCLELFYQSTFI